MTHILLVSPERNIFTKLETALSNKDITTEWTDTGQNALSKLSAEKFDLFITADGLVDMTGRQLVEKVIFQNAMMNCVVLSNLDPDKFHETYEGFGVLMQFPLIPDKQNVQDLLAHLDRIARISSQTNRLKGEPI